MTAIDNQQPALDLLDYIAESAGTCSLSDLHTSDYKLSVFTAVQKIPEDWYDLKQWQDAACYILQTQEASGTEKAIIKNRILDFLQND